ncbi:hypothetical protein NECAME_10821 [Necator americanus]|nr:hypothetical protein NECAME_10821 [Necator americanus]ETN77781.1 hypothetical protein NECAME_10821 [Necator americanus]
MLSSPLRIFRCYICVENRIKAPLTDLSLLVEHLAMHFEFHLFECGGCNQKFATPFLANFHIKEGRCKREEGELCDDGGAPLKAVALDSVEFESFCHLQNAITKCTELMLYELNYGEDDLMNALNSNKQNPKCPNSPELIIREERQIQTSPPLDSAPTKRVPSATRSSATATPQTNPAFDPSALGSSVRERSPSDISLATNSTTELGAKEGELAEGCSFISDDEEEGEALKQLQVSIEVDDGLSMVSNSPSITVAPASPPHSPPSTGASSIPSLLSLKFDGMFGYDLPPRRDIRQPVVMPQRPPAPAPTDYIEADSSSTAQQSFFFQTLPPQLKQHNLNSLNDAVYPVLVPVYSDGVQVFPGQPQLVHPQTVPGHSSQMPPIQSEAISPHQTVACYTISPTVGEVSSSTNSVPIHDDRRFSENLPVFPPYVEHNLALLRVESPVHGHLPHDFIADINSTIEDRPESDLSRLSFEDDGYHIADDAVHSLSNSDHSTYGKKVDQRPNGTDEEWLGCEERAACQRLGGIAVPNIQKIVRNREKQRYSYGITVVRSFDPHSGTTISPRRRDNDGRRSRASSRARSSQKRSRTTGPRSRPSHSRSPPRASHLRNRSPSSSPVRRSTSMERSRRRQRPTREKFEIFPPSILDRDMPGTSRNSERSRHRSKSRRRTESNDEREELEDEE